jgi:hypothetical protein
MIKSFERNEAVMASGICLEGLRKTTEDLRMAILRVEI